MRRSRIAPFAISVSLALLATGSAVDASASVTPAPHTTHTCVASATTLAGPTHEGHLWGIVRPRVFAGPSTCQTSAPPAHAPRAPKATISGATTLNYGSGPVMGTTSGTPITVVPAFWTPSGYSFGTGYESLIEQYLADVAHDSGSLTNVYSVLHQYTDASNQPINYNIVAGAAYVDTNALPAGQCTPDTGANACITDAQIQSEVANVMTADSLAPSLNTIVVMYLPQGLESCSGTANLASSGQCSVVGSAGSYCGYHSATASNGAIYAVLPYAVTPSSSPTCSVGETPNANIAADSEISVTSHELSEAFTDPTGMGWYTFANSNEVGDNCNFIFDSPAGGSSGAFYNQIINGHHYYTQEEYSNANSTCLQGADYAVSFDPNGAPASVTSQVAAYNSSAALTPNAFTRAGYTFTGWNTNPNGGGTPYADGATYTFTASTTLYAQWRANASDTITFNSAGGSAVSSMSGPDGSTITLPGAPTYAGYTFNGWFVAPSGGSPLTSPYTLAGSTTLYAQWSVSSYVVSFNANNGTGTMANESGTYNSSAALTPNAFTRAGYTFTGWNTNPNGGGTPYADGATYTFTASTTLYAQWRANASDTITFNSAGGSAVSSMSGPDGSTITLPGAPTYAGYTFNGWFVAPSGGSPLTSPYTLAGSTTLYAQWSVTPATVTVTFAPNGGNGTMTSESQNYNTPAPLGLNVFTRLGYTFVGWNTQPNGTGVAYPNGALYSFTVDVTLYAQWSASTVTISFDANGGVGAMTSESSSANSPLTLSASTFTRAGYTFGGWNTAPNGAGASYANGATYSFALSVTLYAQWIASGPLAQTPLVITTTSGTAGMPLVLATSGGSVAEAPTYAVTDGTAQGCAITGGALSVQGAGTCVVVATKAGNATYLSVSSPDTTILMRYVAPVVVRLAFAPKSSALSASDQRVLATKVAKMASSGVVTITASAWRNGALARARALAVEHFVLARLHVRVVMHLVNSHANLVTVVARF